MRLKNVAVMGTTRPAVEVAEVFRRYGEAYRRKHQMTAGQRKVMEAIVNCRTAALGGYVEECEACARWRIHYCSCKNRHCPKCGAFEKAQWLAEQERLMLPIAYYHVVFTIDHAVNDLARVNRRAVYHLLFEAAATTLKAYGRRYLGGEIGVTAVLHTWGQDLSEHLHLHCIVSGGAWQQTAAGERWQACAKGFLFPIVALSRDFRERFCAGLLKLYRQGRLELVGQAAGLDVEALVGQMRGKRWEVFAKEAFDRPEQLYDYLARYIFRIAISNHRLVSLEKGQVRFSYHDNKDGGREKVMELPAVEFMRRFLWHVLPPRFVRVRHYGLHHSAKRKVLERCRAWFELPARLPEPVRLVLHEWVASFTGQDPQQCPFCGQGRMYRRSEFGPVRGVKAALLPLLGIPRRGAVVG